MNEKLSTHKELHVWQKAIGLVVEIYKITEKFPREEIYGITSQMRRAAVTIPSNIAEGYHRNYIKEYIQFLYVSKGSAAELETLVDLSDRLNFMDKTQLKGINFLLEEILKMLTSLISKLKTKLQTIP